MSLLAIDPGNVRSAFVLYEPTTRVIENKGHVDNAEMMEILTSLAGSVSACAIEMIASYGMAVGAEVFETVYWIGRFAERYKACSGTEAALVFRREAKLHLCGVVKANDPNVRQALIDMFGPGKEKAIGKAKTPGPLYGVSGDVWAALAIAVTFAAKTESLKCAD